MTETTNSRPHQKSALTGKENQENHRKETNGLIFLSNTAGIRSWKSPVRQTGSASPGKSGPDSGEGGGSGPDIGGTVTALRGKNNRRKRNVE